MKVHVQLYSILREELPEEAKGKITLNFEETTTLGQVLEDLDISQRVVMSVNDVHESDRARELHDGDGIRIFSSVSGGNELPDRSRKKRRKCYALWIQR